MYLNIKNQRNWVFFKDIFKTIGNQILSSVEKLMKNKKKRLECYRLTVLSATFVVARSKTLQPFICFNRNTQYERCCNRQQKQKQIYSLYQKQNETQPNTTLSRTHDKLVFGWFIFFIFCFSFKCLSDRLMLRYIYKISKISLDQH